MREIIFDTETTGLDPREGHRLVEIGCVEMVNRTLTGAVFHAYFNPGRDMPAEAERVHGLSAAFLADKPRFAELVDAFFEFVGEAPLVAHNAQFDLGFLNAELVGCGRPAIAPERMIDTLALARKLHPGAKHTLDALCSRYGIDRSHRVRHGALLDAELLAQVYIELTGGRQIGLGLEVVAPPPPAPAPAPALARPAAPFAPARAPRPHHASAEELALHAQFIATIKAPLWTR